MNANYDIQEIRKDLESIILKDSDILENEKIKEQLEEIHVNEEDELLEHLTENLDSNFIDNTKHIIKKKVVKILNADGDIKKGLIGEKYMTYHRNPGRVKLHAAQIKPYNRSRRVKLLVHEQEIDEFTGTIREKFTLINYKK